MTENVVTLHTNRLPPAPSPCGRLLLPDHGLHERGLGRATPARRAPCRALAHLI